MARPERSDGHGELRVDPATPLVLSVCHPAAPRADRVLCCGFPDSNRLLGRHAGGKSRATQSMHAACAHLGHPLHSHWPNASTKRSSCQNVNTFQPFWINSESGLPIPFTSIPMARSWSVTP